MKKLGIILDSFSCMSITEANEKGYGFLPLEIQFNNKIYYDTGENSEKILKEYDNKELVIKTSSPSLGFMTEVFEKFSKEFDEVVYLGISSHMSSTIQHARNIAQKLKNVFIMETHLFNTQLVRVAEHIKWLYEQRDFQINDLFEKVNEINETSKTYFVPKALENLIKSGRLSSIKKFILSKVKIFPIFEYKEDGTISPHSIKLTFKNALNKAYGLTNSFIDKMRELDPKTKFYLDIVHGLDKEANDFVGSQEQLQPSTKNYLPLSIAAHTGNEAIGISIMPELK
ncbi:DegV family protein [Mycoplasma sp. CSL10137]|uniref:DegV family protein n=1 Tax=unclassified Mycoplasma TaxID=2683645 RepID=UPI00197BC5C5|nr:MULTISPECIES: DegV family protein [unclassified Mycoplasma]MBN4083360.1 DegV family protein [Mycoplasma sp. CSL10137]MBU4692824.1 DegV family protein [Mycoplasma sp. CSL7491-lung]